MAGLLEEALKDKDRDIRVTCLDKWLFWDNFDEEWAVLEARYRSSKSKFVYKGKSLRRAIDVLTGEE